MTSGTLVRASASVCVCVCIQIWVGSALGGCSEVCTLRGVTENNSLNQRFQSTRCINSTPPPPSLETHRVLATSTAADR